MTNQEYEASCLVAVGYLPQVKVEHPLDEIDAQIADAERALSRLHERRRELVNLHGLNKGEVVL